ncbi:MAG: Asp23/Gls24 family envelope stress response protein [Actinomycetota bacterium]
MLDAGTFKIRQGVLELIAGIALSRVSGASGTGFRSDHPEDLRKRKYLTKGVKAELEDEKVRLELEVNLDYGKDFQELGRQIQRQVKEAVEAMTGWRVEAVDVDVVGVNAT